MRELATVFLPQWWTFKNGLLRSGWSSYVKAFLIVLLIAGFWTGALHYLQDVLARMQAMEGDVGEMIAMKGLSLLLVLVFFLLVFSSLLSSINNFYLSGDLPALLSSPVSWDSIYYSKWLETAIKSSWMILFVVLPVFVSFGMSFKVSSEYYFYLLPVLVLFVLIPSGIGIMLGIIVMAAVPAKRARNVFFLLGLIILAIVFLLFRFLRPERFANPEWFANLTIFLAEIKLPASVLLPSTWAIETLAPFLYSRTDVPVLYVLLLLFTAGAFIVIGNWLFKGVYYKGLVKAQQSQNAGQVISYETLGAGGIISLRHLYVSFLRSVLFFFKGSRKAFVEKDLTVFTRNIGQWSQMFLLSAIVVIYLFSIKALPIEWGTYLSTQLKYIVSFFNIGIVGFILSAVAARLVLPSVDNEGQAFWIVRISPVTMQGFLWNKFFIAFIPLLFLSQVLIVISNIFLGVKLWFMLLGVGTCLVMSASIAALAVGVGACTAKFLPEEVGDAQTGFRGTAFMLASFVLIALTVMLEVIPVSGMFAGEMSQATLTSKGWLITGGLMFGVFLLNAAAGLTAMRIGTKKLEAIE